MRTKPRRVVHVTTWPGPPFDGGRINRYHVLKRLSARHRFRFVVLREPRDPPEMDSEALAALGIDNDGVEIVDRPTISNAGRLAGLLTSQRPPGVDFFEKCVGDSLRAAVDRVVHDWSPDVLMVWSPNWAATLHRTATHLRRVLFACDSMSMLHRSIACNSAGWLRRLYHHEVARRYRHYEHAYFPGYDEVVFVGPRDAAAVALPPSVSVAVIPNGVDTERLQPAAANRVPTPPLILFHGNLAYVANADCVRFLATVLGPWLQRRLGPNAFEIRVIGGGADDRLRRTVGGLPWLKLAGYVDDLAAELRAGTVYAAPLAMGGGIKNKVLEAMALARRSRPSKFSRERRPSRPRCPSSRNKSLPCLPIAAAGRCWERPHASGS